MTALGRARLIAAMAFLWLGIVQSAFWAYLSTIDTGEAYAVLSYVIVRARGAGPERARWAAHGASGAWRWEGARKFGADGSKVHLGSDSPVPNGVLAAGRLAFGAILISMLALLHRAGVVLKTTPSWRVACSGVLLWGWLPLLLVASKASLPTPAHALGLLALWGVYARLSLAPFLAVDRRRRPSPQART